MIWHAIILLLLTGTVTSINAQHFVVNLSPRHQQKLATVKDGHKRLVKYYRFLKKDSVRQRRRTDQYYKKQLDSLWQIVRNRRLERWSDSGESVVFDTLLGTNARHADVLRQGAKSLDTARSREMMPNAMQFISANPPSAEAHNIKTRQSDHLPGATTPFMLLPKGELIQGADSCVSASEPFDSTMIKTHLENLRRQAKDYFSEHTEALKSAQTKLQKMLSRYRDFANSADLKKAIKQSSLKEKKWTERLVAAGGFNIVSIKPFSADIAPSIGYQFNAKWTMGAGFRHRLTTGDSVLTGLSTHSTGITLFTKIDIWRSVYVQGEWERTRTCGQIKEHPSLSSTSNCFIGLGKRMLIHPKVYLTLTVLYNIVYDNHNSTYPGRLVIRPGFQFSELAVRRKRINYNPNR